LVEAVGRNLKGLLEMKANDAGMHLVGWLPENISDREVAEKAAGENIRLVPISDYSINQYPLSGLVFGYAAFNEKQIKRGIGKLTKILTEMARNQKALPLR
jgi:GntR family transcriptional regulator/MocR family aminotransferase